MSRTHAVLTFVLAAALAAPEVAAAQAGPRGGTSSGSSSSGSSSGGSSSGGSTSSGSGGGSSAPSRTAPAGSERGTAVMRPTPSGSGGESGSGNSTTSDSSSRGGNGGSTAVGRSRGNAPSYGTAGARTGSIGSGGFVPVYYDYGWDGYLPWYTSGFGWGFGYYSPWNYNRWVFGCFADNHTHGCISPIIKFDSAEPAVLQALLFWTRSALGAKDGFKPVRFARAQ